MVPAIPAAGNVEMVSWVVSCNRFMFVWYRCVVVLSRLFFLFGLCRYQFVFFFLRFRILSVFVSGFFFTVSVFVGAIFPSICNGFGFLSVSTMSSVLTVSCLQVYPVGIPMFYAWLLFRHRHRIYPKRAIADGVSAERRMVDKKIAHTVLLWEVGPFIVPVGQ